MSNPVFFEPLADHSECSRVPESVRQASESVEFGTYF
jgi:hypothetical protein